MHSIDVYLLATTHWDCFQTVESALADRLINDINHTQLLTTMMALDKEVPPGALQ